jgi:hypothetical protein
MLKCFVKANMYFRGLTRLEAQLFAPLQKEINKKGKAIF